jgi:hypothetical protein
MNVEPFTMEHYIALCGVDNLNAGIVNLTTGPAFALVDGGHVLAIGGVRVQGIGQAWTALSDEGRSKPKAILRTARAVLHEAIVQERLYRIYAEATVDAPAWFKHLGFHQQDNLFVR